MNNIPGIEEVNMIKDKDDIVVFSTDVSAMYPSLDINTVAAVAAKEFLNSDIDLTDVCHTRTRTRGQKPGITTEEVLTRTEKTRSKFAKPARTPTKEEAKKMFSVALETLIKVAMESHLYTFNKDIL